MASLKKRAKEFETPYPVTKAITKGDAVTKLSMFVMGLGNLAHKQIVKGILFLAVEIAYLLFMIEGGINNLYHLITLGGRAQEEVWNEAKGIYEYTGGDMTILFLLYGVATIFITVLFFMIWRVNMKSAYEVECRAKEGKHINTIKEDLEALVDKRLHWTLLTLPILGIVIFTILPLVFMICMAFTSYSKVGDHLTIFHWVGLKNFSTVLGMGNSIGKTFWSVLGWTLIWAVLATFLNYILGMILAIVINRKTTRIKGFWRFCFMLSAAIPQFVSLLLMRTMLKDNGLINNLLVQAGLISSPLPFLTNAPVCAAGATTPEPDPGVEGREEGLDLPGGQIGVRLLCGEVGVCWGREEWSGSARRADRREIVVCGRGECVGGRGEGLDSPGGRIGVSLLTGAKFGDRMKKNISGVFCA